MAVTLIALDGNENEYPLDISKGSPITADFNFKDIKDLKTKGSHTYNFRLPSTVANEKYFGHYFMVGSYLGGSGSYNPFQRREAFILQDTIEVFRGYIQLTNVYLRQGNKYEYECIIFSSEVNFLDSLKGLKMSQLNWSELQHELNATNIFESWNSNSIDNGNLIWSLWDYGQGFASNDSAIGYANYFQYFVPPVSFPNNMFSTAEPIDINLLRPQVRVAHIFKKILAFSNYTYTSDFLDSTYFNKVYCDINFNGSAPNSTDIPPQLYTVEANNSVNQNITYFSGEYNQLLQADTEVSDESGAWSQFVFGSNTFSKFTCQRSGNYVFTLSANLTIPSPSNQGADGFKAFRNPNFNTYPFSSSYGWTQSGQQHTTGATSTTQTMMCNAGDEVIFAWWNSEERNAQTITIADFKINITTSNSFTAVLGNQVFIPTMLGSLKVEDWVKGIMAKFNLVVSPNPNDSRNLIIEPYTDYVESGDTKDWSDKIDFTKDVQIIPPTKYSGKRVAFRDNTDGSYVQQTISNDASTPAGGFSYGSYIQPGISNQFAENDTTFKTVFLPTINYPLNGMNVNLGFYSCPRWILNDGVRQNAGGMCLSFYHGTHTLPLGQHYTFGSNIIKNVVPFFSEYDTKNFTDAQATNVFSINWHPGVTIPPQDWDALCFKGLAIKYWRNYLLDNFNVNSRMLSCHMRLDSKDISDFSFSDTITINSQNYRVNSIKGYPVSSTGLCKVELLATFDSISVPIVVAGDNPDYDSDPAGDIIVCDFELVGFNLNTGLGAFVSATQGTSVSINQTCCQSMGLYWYDGDCYNSVPNDEDTPPDETTDVIDNTNIDDDDNATGNPHDDFEDEDIISVIDGGGNTVVVVVNNDSFPTQGHGHTHTGHGHNVVDGGGNKLDADLYDVTIKGNKNRVMGEGGKVAGTGGKQIFIDGNRNIVRGGVQRARVQGNNNRLDSFDKNLDRWGENINFETTLRDVVVSGDNARVFITGDNVQSTQVDGTNQGSSQKGTFIRKFQSAINDRDILVGQYGIFTFTNGKYNTIANKHAFRFAFKSTIKIDVELIGYLGSETNGVFKERCIINSTFLYTCSQAPILLSSTINSSDITSGFAGSPSIETITILKDPYLQRFEGGGIAFKIDCGRQSSVVDWQLKVNYQTTPLPPLTDIPVGQPNALSNCVLWLDACNESSLTLDANDNVGAWNDLSDEGNNVLQSNTTYKPRYNRDFWQRPYLDFDGTTALLSSTDSDLCDLYNGDNTIFVVYKSDVTTAEYYGQVLVGGVAGNTYVTRVGLRINANGGAGAGGSDSITYSNQTSFTDFNACNITSAGVTDLSIAVGRKDGSNVKVLDGNGNSDTGTTGIDVSTITRFNVGGASYTGTTDVYEFNGRMHEVICYNRALSDSEINQVIAYLKNKWDLI